MKQKLKKLIVLFTFIMAGILLNSCQEDDQLEQVNLHENYKFTQRNLDELFNEDHFVKAFQKLPKKKKNVSNHLSKTIMEEQYGFTILGNIANEVITDSITSYTLKIRKDNTNHLENLIVQISNYDPNDISAYIFEYLNNYTIHYNGDVKITPIIYNANQATNTTARVKYECKTVVFPCVNHPSGPEEGQTCDGPTTKTYCYYVDIGGGGGGGGDAGSGGDTSSGSGTTGGANSSGSTSDPVAPPPTENHTPVYTVPVAEAPDPKTAKLHDIVKNSSLLKGFITSMHNDLDVNNYETGYSVMKDNTGAIGLLPAVNRGTREAVYRVNDLTIGGFHNHPYKTDDDESGYPMFSAGDLGILFELNNRHPSTATNIEFMFNGLVVKGNIYAIVPNNPSLLSALASKFQNESTIKKFNNELKDLFDDLESDNDQEALAIAFLNFVNVKYNLDISLYQMNMNDLYNVTNTWTEINIP